MSTAVNHCYPRLFLIIHPHVQLWNVFEFAPLNIGCCLRKRLSRLRRWTGPGPYQVSIVSVDLPGLRDHDFRNSDGSGIHPVRAITEHTKSEDRPQNSTSHWHEPNFLIHRSTLWPQGQEAHQRSEFSSIDLRTAWQGYHGDPKYNSWQLGGSCWTDASQ